MVRCSKHVNPCACISFLGSIDEELSHRYSKSSSVIFELLQSSVIM